MSISLVPFKNGKNKIHLPHVQVLFIIMQSLIIINISLLGKKKSSKNNYYWFIHYVFLYLSHKLLILPIRYTASQVILGSTRGWPNDGYRYQWGNSSRIHIAFCLFYYITAFRELYSIDNYYSVCRKVISLTLSTYLLIHIFFVACFRLRNFSKNISFCFLASSHFLTHTKRY